MKQPLFFLGYCVDEATAYQLSGVSIAGNNMQLSLLKQLHSKDQFKLYCFTIYPVAPYPSDDKLYYTKATIPIFNGLQSTRVSFMNMPVIKQIWQSASLYRNVKGILRLYPNSVIITFNMFPQIGHAVCRLKKKYPGSLLITLLADLPIDDNPNRSKLDKMLRRLFNRITEKAIPKVDKLIVLNENAARSYAPGKPFIVMEGGIDNKDTMLERIPMSSREKVIVFSGMLTEYNGVLELIEAMKLSDSENIKLRIYGRGPLQEKVSLLCQQSNKTEYMGFVDNKKMKSIQREAYILVNPRPVDDPIALVTFPSKIFEYLISGSPVLSTRLNGFTDEYFDKMFFVETNSPEELARKIDEIMAMPYDELDRMAQNAKDFVLTEKNWGKQVSKIIDYIFAK